MIDKKNEQFSALMDDELEDYDQELEQLLNDEELRRKWMRYHLIRDAVSGHFTQPHAGNLADQVSRALAAEPAILAPRRFRSRPWLKQAAGLAVAATVSTIAILSIQQVPESGDLSQDQSRDLQTAQQSVTVAPSLASTVPVQVSPINSTIQFSENTAAIPAWVITNSPSRSHPVEAQITTTSAKLSSYLVNHNEYSVSAQMQGMLPYMRIVTVTPNDPAGDPVTVRFADDK